MLDRRYQEITQEIRGETLHVFDLYARGDFNEACTEVEKLLYSQSQQEMPAEKLEILRCYLRFLLLFMKFERDGQWDCRSVRSLSLELEIPLATPLGNHERLLTLLQLKTNAGDDCDCPLSLDEFHRIINDPQLLERGPELWLAVCRWAYVNGYTEPLERAYEYLTVHRDFSMHQESWRRVNLMLKLLRGTATRLDVSMYVDSLQMVPQIMEFREDILPGIRERFLWDESMEQKMLRMLVMAREKEKHFSGDKDL
ncbi:hypothetical protein KDL29_09765 [bacterium]|nr:hypothetical protein [bacterium]